jgi:hypothetical protein
MSISLNPHQGLYGDTHLTKEETEAPETLAPLLRVIQMACGGVEPGPKPELKLFSKGQLPEFPPILQ